MGREQGPKAAPTERRQALGDSPHGVPSRKARFFLWANAATLTGDDCVYSFYRLPWPLEAGPETCTLFFAWKAPRSEAFPTTGCSLGGSLPKWYSTHPLPQWERFPSALCTI